SPVIAPKQVGCQSKRILVRRQRRFRVFAAPQNVSILAVNFYCYQCVSKSTLVVNIEQLGVNRLGALEIRGGIPGVYSPGAWRLPRVPPAIRIVFAAVRQPIANAKKVFVKVAISAGFQAKAQCPGRLMAVGTEDLAFPFERLFIAVARQLPLLLVEARGA